MPTTNSVFQPLHIRLVDFEHDIFEFRYALEDYRQMIIEIEKRLGIFKSVDVIPVVKDYHKRVCSVLRNLKLWAGNKKLSKSVKEKYSSIQEELEMYQEWLEYLLNSLENRAEVSESFVLDESGNTIHIPAMSKEVAALFIAYLESMNYIPPFTRKSIEKIGEELFKASKQKFYQNKVKHSHNKLGSAGNLKELEKIVATIHLKIKTDLTTIAEKSKMAKNNS